MLRTLLSSRFRRFGIEIGPMREDVQGGIAIGLSAVAVLALGITGRAILDTERPASGETAVAETSGAYLPTSDDWIEQLTNPSAWRNGRFRGRQRPMTRAEEREQRLQEEREEREARLREEQEAREASLERARELGRERGTYRTMCVRLCDGYFFPISFATTPDRFASDEAQCRARCGSPARLYVYPNPGGEPEQMTDVRGQPYSALNTAFLFRTAYDEACTCRPHPWQQEALARHRAYAERAQGRKQPVAAKVQPPPREAEAALSSAPPPPSVAQRPEGAMLLGAPEIKAPTRQTSRAARAAQKEPPRERRGESSRPASAGRPDWAARAFAGN